MYKGWAIFYADGKLASATIRRRKRDCIEQQPANGETVLPVFVIRRDPASLAALREKMAKDIRREALVTATEADDAARAAMAAIQPKARGK